MVEDGTDREPAGDEGAGPASPPAGDERVDKPISFDFKLRLGSRESTAALAGRGTGELVQLQPIDWDSFTGLKDDDAPREYKTEGNLPSIIVELANQVAGSTDDLEEVEPPEPFVPPPPPDIVVATVEDDPMLSAVVEQILDDPVPAAPAAPLAAPVAPLAAPVAPAPTPPVVAPPVIADPAEEPLNGPIELPRIVAATPDVPSGETVMPVSFTPTSSPATPVTPPDSDGARPVQMFSGPEAMAMAAVAPPTPTPTFTPASPPAPVPPLQLAKIERRPGAERPNKPVDFHALLGQAGLQPVAVKRRKKRHVFRTLLKLVVVLAIIGTGLFFGKKYILDLRWDGTLEPYATEVAEARDLKWEKAVPMETVSIRELGSHLTATALGPDPDGPALGAEWRAMGLLEGDLDLDAVGRYSAGFRPVVYDPAERTIYVADDVSGDLRDLYLYQALDMALLDQHIHWSDGLDELGASQRAGRVALVAADASDVAWGLLGADSRELERITQASQDLRDDIGIDIGGAADYPSDLLVGPDEEARALFGNDVVSGSERDALVKSPVDSDAAVLDSLRPMTDHPTAVGEPGDMAGLVFWYYVLAGRLSDADAWNAAVAWNGDETRFESGTDGDCVSATIATVDDQGRDRLLDALQRWAAAAPPEAATTVAVLGTERIEVHSCDPGPAADTKQDGGIERWGLGNVELAAIDHLSLDSDEAARTCTVNALRNFGILGQLEAGDTEGAQTAIDAILTSCTSS